MSAHKPTPGPWTAQASAAVPIVRRQRMPNGEADTFIGTVFGLDRAFVCRLDFGYGKKQDEANAHLIAAAPELLAALKMFNLKEESIVSGTAKTLTLIVPFEFIQAAAAAIAKAEGRD